MGIRTVMVTGDNRLTAAKIADESGVDDFLAEATPEAKLALIREQQADGRLVAMTGDGTNDAPALAQADVGVAMNTGTQAAREAGNMVDLDSNPTKLIEIVEVGKQLLITRGALTTFSIANDVAKYFAILPAVFAFTYGVNGGRGPIDELNIMSLGTPQSAIISAIVFNALIIPMLVPLALRGVRYRPGRRDGAAAAQPADLRRRRPDRAVRRDQADRPDRPQPPGGVTMSIAIGHPRRRRRRATWSELMARRRRRMLATGFQRVLDDARRPPRGLTRARAGAARPGARGRRRHRAARRALARRGPSRRRGRLRRRATAPLRRRRPALHVGGAGNAAPPRPRDM